MYGIITRTGDTLSKPRSAARASERCKAFFTCGADKVYTQFTDLGTATIISSVNLALFSRVVTWSMLFYRCRASIKCIFHFQCIACIWFRRQFWFTSYFILWLENIAMERRERKNRTGNGNACHGEFRNLQRDFNAWMMLKTNVWSVQRSKVIQFHLEPFIAVVLWLILICRVWNEALTKTRLFVCVQIVETRTMHPLVLSECITFSAVHENVRIGTPYSSICWAFFLSLLACECCLPAC